MIIPIITNLFLYLNVHKNLINFIKTYFFISVNGSTGLRLTSMTAPVVADLREIMELDCHFDMGNEELYAVKWYKDDQEFFR